MKTIIKFFLILFLSSKLFCQAKKIDSLHVLYRENQFNNLQKAENYIKEAVLLSAKLGKDSLMLVSNHYLIEVLLKKRKIEEALQISGLYNNFAKKLKAKKHLSLSFLYLGEIYRRLKTYDKSLQNIEEGLLIAKKNNFLDVEHRLLNAKAILFKRTNNKNKAKEILEKLLKNDAYNNTYTLTYSYNSLAGLFFRHEKNKDSSTYFYKKGIDLIQKTDNKYLKTILFINYSELLLESENPKEALSYLLKAKELASDTYNYSSLFFINNSLAFYHHKKREYPEAIRYYKTALDTYGKYADGIQIADTYWQMSEAMYFNKEYKEGFLYQEKLLYLKDSLFTIEKNKTFEKLQTEYEVAKKNHQINFLEKEKVLEDERKKLVYGIGSLLLFLFGGLIFVYKYKLRSEKKIQKQEQQLHNQEKEQLKQAQKIKHIEGFIEGEEKEKNRIAIELHDGIGGKLAGVKHFVSSLVKTGETSILSKNISDITKEVRLLSHSLSYTYSLQQPLQSLLNDLQEQYKNHFSVEVILYPEDEIQVISDEKKLFLYRTIQELAHNIYKYAKATQVTISLTNTDELLLLVEDDGIGFDTNTQAKGIGLQNIKEKLVKFNGALHIDSFINRGTTIIIKLPNECHK